MAAFYQRVLGGEYGNHVLPFLWLRDEGHDVIADYLEKIAAADISEICLESRPHPDFCGDAWWADLEFIISECKRLGLKIWILDDAHFPTGYANGALERPGVERALKKTVLIHRALDVVGPMSAVSASLANPFDDTEEFLGAVATCDGRPVHIDFRREGDTLYCDVPDGLCRITLLFTSVKTGHNDAYINMVDRASCRELIDAVYEPHFERFADEFGSTILGFFSDEPCFMNEKGVTPDGDIAADSLIGKSAMALPWSEELENRLRIHLGAEGDEAFFTHLVRLWARDESGAHVRHAYMDEATRLYHECFDKQVATWCHKHGVMHIGHVIEDKDCHARLGMGAGHFFRAMRSQDMAGVDVVINQLVPGMDSGLHSYGRGAWDMEFFTYGLAKLGSSAAHLDPWKHGRCMAEVFGAFGWHEGLKEMTWIANHFLVRGVNWFVPHAFSMAPFPDADCPPHFYAHGNNPQFRQFGKLMTYMNRMGDLLSGGCAVTTAAVLYHAEAEWAGEAMPMQRVSRELMRAQIDFDFVPTDAFDVNGGYAVDLLKDGRGFLVGGQVYRCLVVPFAEYVGSAVLGFIERATQAGVAVFLVGGVPSRLYDAAKGDVEGARKVVRDGYLPIDSAAFSQSIVIGRPEGLVPALRARGLFELQTSEPQPWLRLYRYDHLDEGDGEEHYLFAVNEHPRRAVITELHGSDGEVPSGLAFDVLNEGTAEPFTGALHLEPYESRLIVLGASGLSTRREQLGDEVVVNGPWSLSFSAPLDYPVFRDERVLNSPQDGAHDVAYFERCGTFRYETSFEVSSGSSYDLDLGDVYEIVEVVVDGVHRGSRIAPPYRVPVGDLTAGLHELVIEVTNTLDKTVTDMFALTEPREPSGLFGPVLLRERLPE